MGKKRNKKSSLLEDKTYSIVSASLAALSIGMTHNATPINKTNSNEITPLRSEQKQKVKLKPILLLKLNFADPAKSESHMHTSHASHSSHASHYSHYSSSSSPTIGSSSSPSYATPSTSSANILKSYKGAGTKNTKPFTALKSWNLKWETDSGEIEIELYNSKGKLQQILVNESSSFSGSSFFPLVGKYYLRVITKGNWKIKIVSE